MNDEGSIETCQRIFRFSFPMLSDNSKNYELEYPVEIPYLSDPLELSSRLVEKFFIPVYIEEALEGALVKFIRSETTKFYDKSGSEIIKKFQDGDLNIENALDQWEKAYVDNTVEFGGDQFGSDDAEVFSTVYHKLVHSPALEAMLQVENSYAGELRHLLNNRDVRLNNLHSKQSDEMQLAMEGVGTVYTENQVTAIAALHLEQHNMELAKFASKVDCMRESQKREYRDWLMSLVETSCGASITSPVSSTVEGAEEERRYMGEAGAATPLEESFTIHLGSQLKHMYNIRILAADPLDLAALNVSSSGQLEREQPERLETALSLYSSDLSGLVLLTDSYLGTFSGITKDLLDECEGSTELHFNTVEQQLDKVRESVKEAVEWRRAVTPLPQSNVLTCSEIQARKLSTKYLQTGDVYVTKHSNLSQVHVVFHMVIDDSIKSSDINSRQPAILGLRNILKCACSNDITTLTIPVLLTHEITPEMTLSWCAKRAELVYKCVKGFMIEMTSWGGSELKNLQFLVPKGIDEELFNHLAMMLPSVFKVSNPLVLKADTPTSAEPRSKKHI